MDDAVETFVSITSASEPVARRYLEMTDGDYMQAVQLYFDAPDLAAGADQPAAPPVPSHTRPQLASTTGSRSSSRVVNLEDSDEEMDFVEDERALSAAAIARAAEVDEDEAMARRIQDELFAGGDSSGGLDADGVRAPIAPTRQTLMDDDNWGPQDMQAQVAEQMIERQRRRLARPSVFNQQTAGSSIWDDGATGGSSRAQSRAAANEPLDSKSARLADLFRPPFDLMKQIPWDAARDLGKDELKWIMVNIQDSSIFDCQKLNRDIWSNQSINEIIRANFVFLQYSKDDTRATQYLQYYFQDYESSDAYPHISIIDPRTGEKMKTWSGAKKIEAGEFLMQIVEFLDRYSLDVTKKNPVAKRKAETPKALDVGRLTEQEMLDLALQNSLDGGEAPGPKEHDPDDLTKSFGDVSKGKGREGEADATDAEASNGHVREPEIAAPTTFSRIASDKPHVEPTQGPGTTRIQFKYPDGTRAVRKFNVNEPVSRLYEWLKADPLEGKKGVAFDLRFVGRDLGGLLGLTIESAGLKNGSVMVEYLEE